MNSEQDMQMQSSSSFTGPHAQSSHAAGAGSAAAENVQNSSSDRPPAAGPPDGARPEPEALSVAKGAVSRSRAGSVAGAAGKPVDIASRSFLGGDDDYDEEDEEERLVKPYDYNIPWWHRWGLMTFACVAALIAGPLVFNWPPLDDIMNWSNANAHLCDPSDPSYELREYGEIYCRAKELANENMAGTSISVLYIFDFVGGVMLDAAGAKVTCAFGFLLEIIGWLLLAVSTPFGFRGYKAGIVLLAAGCDPIFFGTVSASNLFPNWTSTAISIIGTVRSLSFADGLLMRGVMKSNRSNVTLKGVALVWGAMVVVLMVLGLFLVPWRPFPKVAHVRRDTAAPSLKTEIAERPQVHWSRFWGELKRQVSMVWPYIRQWTFGVFILIAIVQLLRNSYYSNSYKVHLPDTVDFYEISSPLSVLPCPLMGVFADRVSSAIALAVIVITATLGMLFAAIRGGVGIQCISIVFNWWFQSFSSSEFYVFLAYNYPLAVYGKLAGATLLIGGCFGLLGGPMNTYADREDKYAAMDILVTGIGAAAFFGAIVLHYTVERSTRERKRRQAERRAERQRQRLDCVAA